MVLYEITHFIPSAVVNSDIISWGLSSILGFFIAKLFHFLNITFALTCIYIKMMFIYFCQVGQIMPGVVNHHRKFGIFVEFAGGLSGHVHVKVVISYLQ